MFSCMFRYIYRGIERGRGLKLGPGFGLGMGLERSMGMRPVVRVKHTENRNIQGKAKSSKKYKQRLKKNRRLDAKNRLNLMGITC